VGFLFFADIAVKKPKGWHERSVGFFQQWFCLRREKRGKQKYPIEK